MPIFPCAYSNGENLKDTSFSVLSFVLSFRQKMSGHLVKSFPHPTLPQTHNDSLGCSSLCRHRNECPILKAKLLRQTSRPCYAAQGRCARRGMTASCRGESRGGGSCSGMTEGRRGTKPVDTTRKTFRRASSWPWYNKSMVRRISPGSIVSQSSKDLLDVRPTVQEMTHKWACQQHVLGAMYPPKWQTCWFGFEFEVISEQVALVQLDTHLL
jgi:hypothetical protein